jgi:hypothetical protein
LTRKCFYADMELIEEYVDLIEGEVSLNEFEWRKVFE